MLQLQCAVRTGGSDLVSKGPVRVKLILTACYSSRVFKNKNKMVSCCKKSFRQMLVQKA